MKSKNMKSSIFTVALMLSCMPLSAHAAVYGMEDLLALRCMMEGVMEERETMPALQRVYLDRLLDLIDQFHNGAHVNTVLPKANRTTALHNACALGYVDVVEWLLQQGANPNLCAANGATPRQCIGPHNSRAIDALLKQYGAK